MPANRRAAHVVTTVTTVALLATLSPPGPASAAVSSIRCVAPPIAHRGDSARAPENTLPAYRTAWRAGVTRWEMDLRFTAGDVPVLLHDPTVDRTTDGTGEVAGTSLAQLRSLDAGSWFSPRYAGVKVPTLHQVLRYGRTRGATFLVELKTRPTATQMAAFLARLRWLGVLDRVRVTSFDEQTVLDVRAARPGLRTGISDYPNDRDPSSARQFGRGYMAHHEAVTADRVASMRARGVTVHPWPADTRRTWVRLARHGTGPVVTNRPHAYLVWARGYCS